MARPSKYDFELCVEICDQIALGRNIIEVLNSNIAYPTWSTFRRWKNTHDELRTLYVNSLTDKAVAIEDEIDSILNDLRGGILDASTANVLIQTLKWKMAKFYPKMFGEKVEQSIDMKVTNTMTEAERLAEIAYLKAKLNAE